MTLKTSARNKLPGTVMGVKLGQVTAQIDIRVGDNHVVAVITREAAEELGLKEGDEVYAVVKATDVMVTVDGDQQAYGI